MYTLVNKIPSMPSLPIRYVVKGLARTDEVDITDCLLDIFRLYSPLLTECP